MKKKPKIKTRKPQLGGGKPKIQPGAVDQIDLVDPLANVPVTGDLQTDADAEISATRAALRESDRKQREAITLAVDSEFWFAVVFQSRAQKEAFLAALDWLALGNKYLDGLELCRKLGIVVPKAALRHGITRRAIDAKLVQITREWEDGEQARDA